MTEGIGTDTSYKKHIAIIGSGVSGISCAWALSQSPDKFHVTVYEKNDYLGGHTHTIDYKCPTDVNSTKDSIPVDTGFIVFNQRTYPNFLSFLEHIKVDYQLSDMSFAVSRNFGELEWAGSSLGSLFAQYKNIFDITFWQMIFDILRFNALATKILELPETDSRKHQSIGQYLKSNGYSQSFSENYLIPMTAAIWSTPADVCWQDFPAETLIRFMSNHGLLRILEHPQWYTISEGSRNYVEKAMEAVDEIVKSTEVKSISRRITADGHKVVEVTDRYGSTRQFDHVVLACHGDEARDLISDPTEAESEFLKPVNFSANRAVVHCDKSLMPRIRDSWSSWNYLTVSPDYHHKAIAERQICCVTYWMNRLQSIPAEKYGDIFVTLNPLVQPDPRKVVAEFNYTHPIYNQQLIDTQKKLKKINSDALDSTGTFFCGAWTNYGFHEDGFTSGLRVAEALEAECPFPIQDVHDYVRKLDESNRPSWLYSVFWEITIILLMILNQGITVISRLIEAFDSGKKLLNNKLS